jgi:nucleoside-diphosphate-sugar epimerase
MRVFVAGGTGAIGRPLIARLGEAGHDVVVMSRSDERAREVRRHFEAVVCDVFDAGRVARAVAAAKPDVVVHQLTAIPPDLNPRKVAAQLAATNRLRTEGTENLVRAARDAGVKRFVAQSIAFAQRPEGPSVLDETAPLYVDAPASFRPVIEAVASLEAQTTEAGGVVLRYGFFYGPGTAYDAREGAVCLAIDRRRVPVVGSGGGVFSFIHVHDAARATMAAIERAEPGIYNVVEDETTRAAEWLPHVAATRGAPPPFEVPLWLGRLGAGEYGVHLMTALRGASNAKVKRALDWSPVHGWRASLGRA